MGLAALRHHWATPQHRNAAYLVANNVLGAATGILFWLLLARAAGLPARDLGVGFAVVALATTVAVLAKGGLDTAILRHVPGASRADGAALLRFAALVGCAVAALVALGLAGVAATESYLPQVGPFGWVLVAAIACLLVLAWLQDAYFLAEGDARQSFRRNLVLSAGRLLLPVPLVLLAVPHPVAMAWGLALLASVAAAVGFGRRLPERDGRLVPRREFLQSAMRNVTGSAAEFLPGLLLAPIVLATQGPAAAGYFGMAWTAASLLFVASAALSRSALAEMVRSGQAGPAVRRAAIHHLVLVLPAAALLALLAPWVLGLFGPGFADQGAPALRILAASTLFVAPATLYLSVLRARERPVALVAFPAAMAIALVAAAPLLAGQAGLAGVAAAWMAANAPFGIYALHRLRLELRENLHAAPTVVRGPHAE
jgi:O-antigen/teichoic acid export membrane protein